MDFEHLSVLLSDTVALLAPRAGGVYLDGTLGGGGHAEAVLDAIGPDGRLLGIDRDPAALSAATARLSRFNAGGVQRFQAVRGSYADMVDLAAHWAPFDGVVLDIGVSSPQLDHADRGFSFRADGPVDMRMDPDAPLDAAGLLDQLDEPGLIDILRRYGEEPRARRIARAILAGRPWTSTLALAECVERSSGYHNSRTHPATRTFQALRIVVNDEIGQLERGLDAALSLLRVGGRLAVISFHSIEDRIVKSWMRDRAGVGAPKDAYGDPMVPPVARLVSRKGVSGASADPENPRARSARVRAIECMQQQGSFGAVADRSGR